MINVGLFCCADVYDEIIFLRAVEILRDEGLVSTVPRPGTYVSPDAK